MSDVPPPPPSSMPPPSAPGVPPAGGPGYPADAGMPPPKKGLSTGVKIGIGCGALLLLVLILMFACFGIVGKKAKDFTESAEDQAKASEKAEELEREYAFQPPADRTLDEDMVDKFFAVTDDTWDEIGDWVRDMEKRGERIEKQGDEAGFGDAMAAMQGMGRARTALIEALDEHDMAPSAYVWTGMTLMQAHEAAAAGEGASGIPPKNIEIARDHADELRQFEEEGGEGTGKAAILGMAFTFFPRMDVMMPPGMDTTNFGQ